MRVAGYIVKKVSSIDTNSMEEGTENISKIFSTMNDGDILELKKYVDNQVYYLTLNSSLEKCYSKVGEKGFWIAIRVDNKITGWYFILEKSILNKFLDKYSDKEDYVDIVNSVSKKMYTVDAKSEKITINGGKSI